ncbi:polysaccharide biosynthesis protein [Allomuricauda ruestringensis DSM 13258]|uniref:Polysaccharide biosynthesis protein n=1 Tax=Allomuricauda ruestringensis (strain DSM 13258 / CIP 107369 / LMG 19739 / B1) TaxID=886377 RepID=G2PPM5_ALLRU|nr:oligosaccharide flippase family protein [Allomuricauda ruestringensis]AEM70406.1 polysaccharide biosynthesis protein [Allomuricauda ruestringensis DSM 13258]
MKKSFSFLANNKKIIENFSYLSLLQILNMALPLLVFPYLIRVLGKDVYGLVIYAQAIVGYFVVLVNFGFNIIGTKEVSINRDRKNKLNKILSSIFIIKGGLFLFSCLTLLGLTFFLQEFKQYSLLLILTLWMCFNEFIFPVYYFQGIEKMKYITLLTLISRVTLVLFVFVLVNNKDDYLMVPIINGIGVLISGIISQSILYKDGIRYSWQPFYILKHYVLKSFVMALAYASNTLKANFSIVAVKLLFSLKDVAYFDLALKISRLGSTFLELIGVAIFPKMSREKNKRFLRKVMLLCGVLSLIFVLVIQLFSTTIVEIVGGEEMSNATDVLRIIVLFVPFQILGALLGRNGLIVHGYDKHVLYSMGLSSLLFLALLMGSYMLLGSLSLLFVGGIFVVSFVFDTAYRYFMCKKFEIV